MVKSVTAMQRPVHYINDMADCREILRQGSHSFYAASHLLPRDVREPACALYAFCREADDAIDLSANPLDEIDDLYERLERIYAGRPRNRPADRGMTIVVESYAIPRTVPAALLEGFAWDLSGRRYANASELNDYAARVAGTVGIMMAMIMEVRAPDVLARACDLGVAMQLTNIARDVGEDAANGRVYLPLDALAGAGIDVETFLAEPTFTPALGGVVAELLARADSLYRRAHTGIAQLPLRCRPGIFAARRIYAEIGRVIAANGYDSINQRAYVPRPQKRRLLARSMLSAVRPRGRDRSPALPETGFLVDAVAES
ncbi:MAG: phytoene/squalene synthase family protein [Pseudomonadota bacterium]